MPHSKKSRIDSPRYRASTSQVTEAAISVETMRTAGIQFSSTLHQIAIEKVVVTKSSIQERDARKKKGGLEGFPEVLRHMVPPECPDKSVRR